MRVGFTSVVPNNQQSSKRSQNLNSKAVRFGGVRFDQKSKIAILKGFGEQNEEFFRKCANDQKYPDTDIWKLRKDEKTGEWRCFASILSAKISKEDIQHFASKFSSIIPKDRIWGLGLRISCPAKDNETPEKLVKSIQTNLFKRSKDLEKALEYVKSQNEMLINFLKDLKASNKISTLQFDELMAKLYTNRKDLNLKKQGIAPFVKAQ